MRNARIGALKTLSASKLPPSGVTEYNNFPTATLDRLCRHLGNPTVHYSTYLTCQVKRLGENPMWSQLRIQLQRSGVGIQICLLVRGQYTSNSPLPLSHVIMQ